MSKEDLIDELERERPNMLAIGRRVRVKGRNERFKETIDGAEGVVTKDPDEFGRWGVLLDPPNRRHWGSRTMPSWFHAEFLEVVPAPPEGDEP